MKLVKTRGQHSLKANYGKNYFMNSKKEKHMHAMSTTTKSLVTWEAVADLSCK